MELKMRMKRVAGKVAAAALGCLATAAMQAQAVVLTTGNTVLTPGTTSLPGGTVLTNETVAFDGINAVGATNFTGTIQLAVVQETVSGTLDFYYQVFNSASSLDAIQRLTAASFTGFTTDVDWTNTVTAGVASTYADRLTSDTIGFGFEGTPLGSGVITPGTNSALLFIKTDATQYTLGTVNLIDDATANIVAFAPIPEPGTWVLVGGALVAGAWPAWRRKSRGPRS